MRSSSRFVAPRNTSGVAVDRPLRIGVIADEFFCPEYPPLGGFGLAARNFADFFNGRPNLNVEVIALLPPYRGPGAPPTSLHNTPVLQVPTSLRALGAARAVLRRARLDLLVAIDYYPSYFTRLIVTPSTPLTIWLRDPHAPGDWDRILTLAGARFPCEYDESVRGRFRFYRELEFVRRVLGRKVAYAVQEPWLLPRAQAACPWIGDDAVRMVNRIPIAATRSEKPTRPTLLFIGRLVPVKRPWIYFEIAKRLPDYDFLVVGELDRQQHLRKIVDEARTIPNLQFVGRRVDADLHRVIERAWLLVNTSIHEGMPQSVLDCLAFGVPVVSALDYGGTIEQFGISVGAPNGSGLDEVEPFCRAIERLVRNPAERTALGIQGRRFVQMNYSDAAFFRQFTTLIERLDIDPSLTSGLRHVLGDGVRQPCLPQAAGVSS
jgi:glycosyltransferase involved in cell wall biosynthesis